MTNYNSVTVPLYEFDNEGAILPNPVFHRSWDKLHSRTIEYPFAGSQLGDAKRILDVGSVKGDEAWSRWLESLPIDVHLTDYDTDDTGLFKNSTFHQADIRNLSIENNFFDKIFAVSVIEHIGTETPQVDDNILPLADAGGDVEAFKEMLRVLKPGGHIVMTVPFGVVAGNINQSARTYNIDTIQRFNNLAQPIVQDYYEYQTNTQKTLFIEYPKRLPRLYKRIASRFIVPLTENKKADKLKPANVKPRHIGRVTWRRIPINEATATNKLNHTDGVLCGVWEKTASGGN